MAERSTISQVVQIGVEATPGTAVPANKKLQAMGIEPSPQFEISNFRPAGSKFSTLSILGKEWVEADVSGRATYTEIVYPLSSIIGKVTPTTSGSGKKWTFVPNVSTEDNPQTFTVEHGSSLRAAKFTNGLLTEFGLTINRESVEISGSFLARALQDGITMTPTPTTIPLVPVVPTEIDIFLDDTSVAFGTTKLSRALSCEFTFGDRFGPLWVVDSSNPSFVTHIETEPSLTATILMEADAAGMAYLQALRAGQTKFLRIRATGPTIAGGPEKYSLSIDMAVKISESGGFSDEDGVYAIEWTFGGIYDGTWGKALSIEVMNDVAAL